MENQTKIVARPGKNTIFIERSLNCPRDTLWSAWTEPPLAEKWFGPKGFTTRIEKLDLRPGGKWRYIMIGPDKKEYPSVGVFKEIIPKEKLVSTDDFGDELKKSKELDLPKGIVVTTYFKDLGNKSKLILEIDHETPEDKIKHEKMGVVQGWNSSFDKLEELLKNSKCKLQMTVDPNKQEIIIEQEFDYPRELVFKLYIDPELFKEWLGTKDHKMNLENFVPKTGGSFRFIQTDKAGNKFVFKGVFHDIKSPERITKTFEFENLKDKGHVILETTKFISLSTSKTKVISQSVFQSIEDRDSMVKSGMARGVKEIYERMNELLKKINL